MSVPLTLNQGVSVTLDATGSGQVALGPGNAKGPAIWHVTGVVLTTSRPGKAPVPQASTYLNTVDPGSLQGVTYDASFKVGRTQLTLNRGEQLITVWTGGQAGDTATMTLTGTKE